jgi:hypothetical protein
MQHKKETNQNKQNNQTEADTRPLHPGWQSGCPSRTHADRPPPPCGGHRRPPSAASSRHRSRQSCPQQSRASPRRRCRQRAATQRTGRRRRADDLRHRSSLRVRVDIHTHIHTHTHIYTRQKKVCIHRLVSRRGGSNRGHGQKKKKTIHWGKPPKLFPDRKSAKSQDQYAASSHPRAASLVSLRTAAATASSIRPPTSLSANRTSDERLPTTSRAGPPPLPTDPGPGKQSSRSWR